MPLLLAHAALVLLGAIAVWRLPDPPPHPPAEHPSFWRSIGDGIAEAARSEQMWPVLLLNFGVGVFYVGPFMAVLPLVVRDVYHGGAAEIAYVNLAFWAGTIVAAFAFAGLARRLSRRGRLVVGAVSVGAVILLCMALQPPFLVLNALCFVWGLGAGITMTQGRTILQIVAPPTHRARLMSLFQLGLGGGGPIGAFIAGSLAAVLGLKLAMVLPAIAMAVLIGVGADVLAHLDDADGGAAGRRALLRGLARRPRPERLPDVLQGRDQPRHVVVAVQRRRREAQPLGAARHGRVVDRLHVDRSGDPSAGRSPACRARRRPPAPARCGVTDGITGRPAAASRRFRVAARSWWRSRSSGWARHVADAGQRARRRSAGGIEVEKMKPEPQERTKSTVAAVEAM